MKRVAKIYTIDKKTYNSKTLYDLHIFLKNNKYVKSFDIPLKIKKSKYGAQKITVNNILFDSIMEAEYYIYLLEKKDKKEIKDFSMQISFDLLPKQKNKFTGKTILAVKYIADFVIIHNNNTKEVIDIKGRETVDFKLKKKMFFFFYPEMNLRCVQWDSIEKQWRDLDDINKDKRARKRNRNKSKK